MIMRLRRNLHRLAFAVAVLAAGNHNSLVRLVRS